MTNDITYVADLIGGDPEELVAALKALINDDVPVAPCVVPEALRYAHLLLEHYAVCMAGTRMPGMPWKKVDAEYCEKVLNVATEMLLVSAGGWEEIR